MLIKKNTIWLFFGLILSLMLSACVGQTSTVTAPATTEPTAQPAEEREIEAKVEDITKDTTVAETGDSSAPEENSAIGRTLLAGTNVDQRSVPLEDVHFDTFNGSYVPLAEASEAVILQLRDAIPPVETPKYTDVATADAWLNDTDTVVGYVDGDVALAYPAKILNFHEIVNEEVNGRPILVSYCPLCNSGIIYDRRVGDQILEFGNTSALYQSDMVMYDRQTFSYWFQVGGDAIVGDLTGQRMEVLPTRFMLWSAWREAYPDSQVLSRDTGFDRPYDRDPFSGLSEYLNQGNFAFPVGEEARNPALPAGERVISLVIEEEARAYPISALAGSVTNDEVNGRPVAIVIDAAETGTVFSRQVGNQVVTLAWDGNTLKDEETGSTWTLTGHGLDGPLADTPLELIGARFSYWFAFVAAFPNASVYQP